MSVSSRFRELFVKAFGRHDGEEAVDLMTSELSTTAGSDNVQYGVDALDYAASKELDFDGAAIQTISLTGAISFTTTNRAAGKSILLNITADGTNRAFTFPAWVFVGTAPTEIAADKTAMLHLTCLGTTEASIVASYAEES